MTQILGLSDRDFEVSVINMLRALMEKDNMQRTEVKQEGRRQGTTFERMT